MLRIGARVHDRRAGDRDEVEAAVDRLQEHRRGRAADLDRIGNDGGRDIRIDADQNHLGIEAVLWLKMPFIDRDHRRGAVGRRRAADLDFCLGAGGTGDQNRRKRCRRQEFGHRWPPPAIFSSPLDYRYFI
jgi:hypothetical protein